MDKKIMVISIGLLEIHGLQVMENKVILESKEMLLLNVELILLH